MKRVTYADVVTFGAIGASLRHLALTLAGLMVCVGCGGLYSEDDAAAPDAGPSRPDVAAPPRHVADAADPPDAPVADAALADAPAGADLSLIDPAGEPMLLGAPLLFAPTAHGFGVNVVLSQGAPAALRIRVRDHGAEEWGPEVVPASRTADIAQWVFEGLSPGQRYDYDIVALGAADGGVRSLYTGSVATQRRPGEDFTFALLSDSHIGADLEYSNQGDVEVLRAVASELGAAAPDFMIHLGDMLDFHEYGFNDPPPDGSVTRAAYRNYRMGLADASGNTPHFATIGNWEGENGCYTAEEIDRSRQQRLLYLPGPKPGTYPEGGSPHEDYYAFTWGDALFVVLNVMSYTPTKHLLSTDPGLPDDWTLGAEQLAWLSSTLANANSKWRFLFIHHTVGGKAGTDDDSAYGRGGGQAAYVGEQATVHQLMLQHGVQIFFYGHDHVFAEDVVDGIHYSDVGNAGAPWMFDTSTTGYTQTWLEYGWTKVAVSPRQVHVQFVKKGGEVVYEYSLL